MAIPPPNSGKVYASLITNLAYLPGLLTLHHSLLSSSPSRPFPFIALYTPSFPPSGLAALSARSIPALPVPALAPSNARDFSTSADPRFADTWAKLAVFSLTQFERVVLLDSDMLIRRNIDDLMDIELADPSTFSPASSPNGYIENGLSNGDGDGFMIAAGHACACNPLRKPHYPKHWTPQSCPFTTQHSSPHLAQSTAPDPSSLPYNTGLNSGLLVLTPSSNLYAHITAYMDAHAAEFTFPDQDLLSRLFEGRWRPLPYVYNALKTLRWKGVHDAIWRDGEVRVVHYILSPKPWDEVEGGRWGGEESHGWWVAVNGERQREERQRGIDDGF